MLHSLILFCFASAAAGIDNRTIVVTGATGRTGSATYVLLKQMGFNVRGLVRDIAKAKQILGCSKCDESEGIFVGDITKQSTMGPCMAGADTLVITTAVSSSDMAKQILFDGVESQVGAFLASPGPEPTDRHVLLMSMQETTLLDTVWNKILARLWGGWSVGFYSLQGETFLMSANVPFTILKACGLDDSAAMQMELLVGHDDKGWNMMTTHGPVSRHDVARVLATAVANPKMSTNLRFDFCAKAGTGQSDMKELLKEAMYSWDPRKKNSKAATIV